jgi:hypothetical protein
MASYQVMEPPQGGSDDAILVRDGFHVLAFIFPWLWLAFHRLWVEALAVVALGLLIAGISSYFELGLVATFTSFLVALFIGLEGPTLKVAALRRRGWREWVVVEAEDAADAELRYYTEIEDNTDMDGKLTDAAPLVARPVSSASANPHLSGPVLGMLGYQARS